MITFVSAFLLLILGYIIYGGVVARLFGADPQRPTPCYTRADGVDYIAMPTWKVFLIQFLNIAGTGPIFGAIQGILFGPAAYIWIVLGCIFGGAVHDYLSGMISLRKGGMSLPELVGDELGQRMRKFMLVFSLFLMVLVGAVFVKTPAELLAGLTSGGGFWGGTLFWMIIIIIYYILATLLPINEIIGRIYPIFGLALLFMAVGVLAGIFTQPGTMPEITSAFADHHPESAIPLFPGLFITIACGAVSGFHATQSPLMARCMKNEKLGRTVFYGSMITEGFVALIWTAAAIKFADAAGVQGDTPYDRLWSLLNADGTNNPAVVVNQICHTWLGSVGTVLAILGVVAAPITSGDTAFRSARLISADFFHLKQNKIYKRLLLSVPIFAIAIGLMLVNFSILWRYFGWVNQTMSVFTLWAVTVWMARHGKCFIVALVPALWMTLVCSAYILVAPEGFQLLPLIGNPLAVVITLVPLILFLRWYRLNKANGTFRTDEEG